jgi:hypothetical protein
LLRAGDLLGHAAVVFFHQIKRIAFGSVGMGEGATHPFRCLCRRLVAHVFAEEFSQAGNIIAGGDEAFGLEVEHRGRAIYAEPRTAGFGVKANQLHALGGFFVGDRESVSGGDVFEVDELLAIGVDETAQAEIFQFRRWFGARGGVECVDAFGLERE